MAFGISTIFFDFHEWFPVDEKHHQDVIREMKELNRALESRGPQNNLYRENAARIVQALESLAGSSG